MALQFSRGQTEILTSKLSKLWDHLHFSSGHGNAILYGHHMHPHGPTEMFCQGTALYLCQRVYTSSHQAQEQMTRIRGGIFFVARLCNNFPQRLDNKISDSLGVVAATWEHRTCELKDLLVPTKWKPSWFYGYSSLLWMTRDLLWTLVLSLLRSPFLRGRVYDIG